MNITVIGCGRWGSFLAWYAAKLGHAVTIYGRESSTHFHQLQETGTNGLVSFGPETKMTTDLPKAVASAQMVIISIGAQGLRGLMAQLQPLSFSGKTMVLCMKGIEASTGLRLTQIVREFLPDIDLGIWVGPGHVQDFVKGLPNCMVVDSDREEVKAHIIDAMGSDLIRFYYGDDLLGNEIGAASKNVIGIAAGILDGRNKTSLKGPLMCRGTREIARLIKAMGGNELTAYGLSHLGDYEATVFSKYSHNRQFGESFVKKEPYGELAEGAATVKALLLLGKKYQVELPICDAVDRIIHQNQDADACINRLFTRSLKHEF